jgi:UDP-glucose 4-epimerase
MKALVTGGAGFIGSNLVDALLARGERVVVLDDISTGRRSNLDAALAANAELVEASITDASAVDSLLAKFAPDVIFHLAAQIDVRRSVNEPDFDALVNIAGTINLIESALRHGAPRIVHSSTGGAIYGDLPDAAIPTGEDREPQPLSPYGQSKLAAEGYLALAQRLHGLSTIALRYGNVYGPRQDPLGEAGVIAIFCARAVDGESPIVYGSGMQTRDYVHVDDVVAANLAAVDSNVTGAVNIGTGRETTVLDLVEMLAPHAGAEFEPDFKPERPGEVARSALDAALAAEVLGWRAQIDLVDGLAQTLDAITAQ